MTALEPIRLPRWHRPWLYALLAFLLVALVLVLAAWKWGDTSKGADGWTWDDGVTIGTE